MSFEDLTKIAPIASICGGIGIGIWGTDSLIHAAAQVIDPRGNEPVPLQEQVLTEAILSALALTAFPLLSIITSPILISMLHSSSLGDNSIASLVLGVEVGVGLRGIEGLVSVALAVIRDVAANKAE